jgi:hypothetical protein
MSEAVRARVERHAQALDDVGAAMTADGIGGHNMRGHVVMAKKMAAGLRAQAATGALPFDYRGDGMYAAAVTAPDTAPIPLVALHHLRAAGLDLGASDTIHSSDLDASLAAAGTEPANRLLIKTALRSAGRLTAA